MKFTVCMKTPDALNYAIDAAVESEDTPDVSYCGDDIAKLCRKWFLDGETVWLEIDTDDMTCNVMAL